MASGNDLIQETRRHLFSGQREQLNKLNGAISTTTSPTTITFDYDLSGIQAGSVIEVDYELMYVWSVDNSAKTAVVQRGHLGSTAATHTDDSVVYVNPKFSNFAIFNALNDEILELSSPLHGLYQMKSVNLTYNAARRGYDLTGVTDVLEVFEIRYEQAGADLYWPEITQWVLTRNMDTSEFASGFALFLHEGADPGRTLRLRYKAPFTGFTTANASTDIVTTTGLHAEAHDIPPMGAFTRLVFPRETKRAFSEHQGEPRRAEEVPPGSQIRAAQGLAAQRAQRIEAEAARLYQRYPARLKVAR